MIGVAATFVLFGVDREAVGGWLIYHKPAYEGKILDAETGAPIEGAVVTAVYRKRIPTLVGHSNEEIHVAETLTDSDGKFKIPSYTTLMGPLSGEEPVHFIVFKSGYAACEELQVLEEVFSNRAPHYSEQYWHARRDVIIRFAPGVVALPRLRTKQDRDSNRSQIGLPLYKQAPLLNKMIREERQSLIRGTEK